MTETMILRNAPCDQCENTGTIQTEGETRFNGDCYTMSAPSSDFCSYCAVGRASKEDWKEERLTVLAVQIDRLEAELDELRREKWEVLSA